MRLFSLPALNQEMGHSMDYRIRIPFLDGVRGYAALWVTLAHLSTRVGFSVPLLQSPGIAVDLFMVVSGFLMAQHSFAREGREPWHSPRTWIAFYIRRMFRIAPLYYVVLVPSFLALRMLDDVQRETLKVLLNVDYRGASVVTAGNVLAHVSFLFGLIPQYCTVLPIPDWSIGLEMQFYALFPFAMLLARRWNVFRFASCGFLVWLGFRKLTGLVHIFALASFLPLNLGPFLVGILLAWAWMQEKKTLTARAAALLLLMTVIAACSQEQTKSPAAGPIVLGVSVLLALMLFSVRAPLGFGIERWLNAASAILGNRFAQFLADVSYGVYLLHMLIMIPALGWLCRMPAFLAFASPLRFLVLVAIVCPITYALAWILFRAVELPGIEAGKAVIAATVFTNPLQVPNNSKAPISDD
jgi:peptidoglycan/LPS O-acetylase OafA/YrhL